MVRLYRGSAPASLLVNQAAWTERWKRIRAELASGDWATETAKATIRPALKMLSYGKCAFCKSKLGVSTYLEIEHYVAKTVDENLAFEWTNLLPACRLCNGAKGDEDHQGLLLKADEEDTEPFFDLDPASGELAPAPDLSPHDRHRAAETVRICDLNRGDLCEARREFYTLIRELLILAGQPSATDAVSALRIMREPEKVYKFVIRACFANSGQPSSAEKDRENFRNGR